MIKKIIGSIKKSMQSIWKNSSAICHSNIVSRFSKQLLIVSEDEIKCKKKCDKKSWLIIFEQMKGSV